MCSWYYQLTWVVLPIDMTILRWPDYYCRTYKHPWWYLKSFCIKKGVRLNNPSDRAIWSNRTVIMKNRPCVFLVVVSRSLVEIYRRLGPVRCSCLEYTTRSSVKPKKIQAGVEQSKGGTTIRARTHIAITVDPVAYIRNVRDRNIYSAYTFCYSPTLESVEFVQSLRFFPVPAADNITAPRKLLGIN